MNEEFILALEQIADEKGISKESILEAVESALGAAYRKDYGKSGQIIRCKINPEKGVMKFWLIKKVIDPEEKEGPIDEEKEISIKEAKKIKKDVKVGDEIEYSLPTHEEFGRIAAQTAKQVIIQKLKEAEREVVFNEYKNQEGKMVSGIVQQIEGGNVVVDLGRANGIMFPSEQVTGENYKIGQRIKVLITKVEETNKGPQIMVSRAADDLIRYLFMTEVPEIEGGSVEIMGIAREAGTRTKMAVRALQEGVDPVGSCVGQRGTRVQAVLSEIGNEKIDIILWDEDPEVYIINALSPAKIEEIKIDKKAKEAVVYVVPEQLSLAIGKNGQNVRLASKLTGWKLDVLEVKEGKEKEEKASGKKEEKEKGVVKEEKKIKDKEKKTEKKEKEAKKKKEEKDFVSNEVKEENKSAEKTAKEEKESGKRKRN